MPIVVMEPLLPGQRDPSSKGYYTRYRAIREVLQEQGVEDVAASVSAAIKATGGLIALADVETDEEADEIVESLREGGLAARILSNDEIEKTSDEADEDADRNTSKVALFLSFVAKDGGILTAVAYASMLAELTGDPIFDDAASLMLESVPGLSDHLGGVSG